VISTTQPTSLWKRILGHIRLADPVTWISPALMCLGGAIASSAQAAGFNPHDPAHWGRVVLAMLMIGPFCTGFSQSINDYFDRELDAINDPGRPIPSGVVSLPEAQINWILLAIATILCSLTFGNVLVTLLVLMGLFLSAAYSVPPLKLKKRFWLGAPAVGLGYVILSWLAGHLIFADLTWPSAIVAILNGGIATGLIFLNDIKSIEGDRKHGLQSVTVALGVHRSLIVSYTIINVCQFIMMSLAFLWGYLWVAGFILFSLLIPIYSEIRLYRQPTHKNFVLYILSSNGFLVAIQLVSGFVVGGYFEGIS
jgi:chlorophyll synthase/bacteriochlorophyll c synthase